MPQRHYPDMARSLLYERQDGNCAACGEPLLDEQAWEIHHADGNPGNNDPDNLYLLHKRCHPMLGRPGGPQGGPQTTSPQEQNGHPVSIPPGKYMYVREHEHIDPHSVEQRLAEGYADHSATPQMRAGAIAKPRFRTWLLAYLDSHATVSMREAIAAGAEITGKDITTVERWLIPMASDPGLVDKYHSNGEWMLRLKPTGAGVRINVNGHASTNGKASGGNGSPASTGDGSPARTRPPRTARGNGSPASHDPGDAS